MTSEPSASALPEAMGGEAADDGSDKAGSAPVVIVSHTGKLGGGAEVVLGQIVDAFGRNQGHVTVAGPPGALLDAMRTRGVRAVALPLLAPRRTTNPIYAAQLVASWARTTLILARLLTGSGMLAYANSGAAALATVGASLVTSSPLIWHQHDIVPQRRINRVVLRILSRACARIVVVSDAVKASLVNLGIDVAKIEVIHNGVRSEFFTPGPGRDVARSVLGLSMDAKTVVMAGRMVPYKGHPLFLEAIARLARDGVDIVGVVAGTVPSYDAPEVDPFPGYEQELRARASSPDLEGRVQFLGNTDMRALLAAADVLAVPSLDEPFPLVVLEGMASGVAVLASDSGGHPEIIAHGETGLLFKTGSVESLCENLRCLLFDDELRRKLGAAALAAVATGFTEAQFRGQIARVLQDVNCSKPNLRGH